MKLITNKTVTTNFEPTVSQVEETIDLNLYNLTNDQLASLESEVKAEIAKRQNNIKRIYQTRGKIPAIKRLRELTGVGLKEAKEAVESMAIAGFWGSVFGE